MAPTSWASALLTFFSSQHHEMVLHRTRIRSWYWLMCRHWYWPAEARILFTKGLNTAAHCSYSELWLMGDHQLHMQYRLLCGSSRFEFMGDGMWASFLGSWASFSQERAPSGSLIKKKCNCMTLRFFPFTCAWIEWHQQERDMESPRCCHFGRINYGTWRSSCMKLFIHSIPFLHAKFHSCFDYKKWNSNWFHTSGTPGRHQWMQSE